MPQQRPNTGNDLAGNAWTFATLDAAWAAYQAALTWPGFLTGTQDSSLTTGFFAGHPVLIFLWGSNVHPELVRGVERLATTAGGTELTQELTEELLRQARASAASSVAWRSPRNVLRICALVLPIRSSVTCAPRCCCSWIPPRP